MPRLEFDASFGLREALSGAAELSGRTGSRQVFISEVLYGALVAGDEEGTTAADREADPVVGQG